MLVELAAQPIYANQPTMTTVMDLILEDGFQAVAFEPFFEASDGLRMIELDALFMRPPGDAPDWGMGGGRITLLPAAPPLPRGKGALGLRRKILL